MAKGSHYAIVYKRSDISDVVHYIRPVSDVRLAKEVRDLHRAARRMNYKSPYRIVRLACNPFNKTPTI